MVRAVCPNRFSTMKTMKFAALLALLGMAIAQPAMATTYAVNDQECCGSGDTAVGSITTDGKLGVLTVSDIVDWTLTLNGEVTLTPASSSVC